MDIVLLHAFPFDSRLFDPLRAATASRLHTPDLPGFGSSRAAPVTTIDAMAQAIRAYVTSANLERFVLGGVSMGGYVALAYVRLFGTRSLAGLVLSNTRASADTDAAKAARGETMALVRARGAEALVERQGPRMTSASAPAATKLLVDEWTRAQSVDAILAGIQSLRDRPDATALLPTIDVPVLCVAGDEDVVTPAAELRAMAKAVPDGTFELITGTAHLSCLEQPAAFGALLDRFVSKPPRPS